MKWVLSHNGLTSIHFNLLVVRWHVSDNGPMLSSDYRQKTCQWPVTPSAVTEQNGTSMHVGQQGSQSGVSPHQRSEKVIGQHSRNHKMFFFCFCVVLNVLYKHPNRINPFWLISQPIPPLILGRREGRVDFAANSNTYSSAYSPANSSSFPCNHPGSPQSHSFPSNH